MLHVARELPELLERVTVLTGSSVGAVNVAFLAGRGLEPQAVEDLAELWRGLALEELVAVARLNALKILGTAPLRFMRMGVKSPATGLLDASGLWRLVARETNWRGIHRHVRSGRFDAVAITGTEIARGETHVFVDAHPSVGMSAPRLFSDFEAIPTELDFRHVLASAAIPFLFPPVKIKARWYMDGGVRNNTPLSPALRMGAESLFIVKVSGLDKQLSVLDEYPGIGHVLGKLLDTMFVDRVAYDLDRLDRINDMALALSSLGPEIERQALDAFQGRGRPRYRYVPYAAVRPSIDLGQLAAKRLADKEEGFSFGRVLSSFFENDEQTSGDAASFLLFDGDYADSMIKQGLEDAQRNHAAIASILDRPGLAERTG